MTGHHKSEDAGQTTDRWIEQQHALMIDLDALLNIEAGLHEVLFQSRPAAMADDLDAVLDVEAGLREVLPTAAPTPSVRPRPGTAQADSLSAGPPLQSVAPQARIRLRAHPDIINAYSLLVLAGALARALDRARYHSISHARAQARARALTRARTHAVELARSLALGIARELDVARALNFDSIRDYQLSTALTRAIDRANDRVRDLDLDLARELSGDRAPGLDHALDAGLAQDLDFALARADALSLSFDRALHRARALAVDLVSAYSLARSRDLTRDRCVDTAIELVNARAEEVRQDISYALRRDLPGLSGDLVDGFLNDFTTSDLSHADLEGVSLDGVRWSMSGTQWPHVVDVDELKARSEETPAGSGIWTVRPGTATVWGFAELQ